MRRSSFRRCQWRQGGTTPRCDGGVSEELLCYSVLFDSQAMSQCCQHRRISSEVLRPPLLRDATGKRITCSLPCQQVLKPDRYIRLSSCSSRRIGKEFNKPDDPQSLHDTAR